MKSYRTFPGGMSREEAKSTLLLLQHFIGEANATNREYRKLHDLLTIN